MLAVHAPALRNASSVPIKVTPNIMLTEPIPKARANGRPQIAKAGVIQVRHGLTKYQASSNHCCLRCLQRHRRLQASGVARTILVHNLENRRL